MNILPISLYNIEPISVQNNQKKTEQNINNTTNPIQQAKLPMPSANLLQVYSGIKTPVKEEEQKRKKISPHMIILFHVLMYKKLLK